MNLRENEPVELELKYNIRMIHFALGGEKVAKGRVRATGPCDPEDGFTSNLKGFLQNGHISQLLRHVTILPPLQTHALQPKPDQSIGSS